MAVMREPIVISAIQLLVPKGKHVFPATTYEKGPGVVSFPYTVPEGHWLEVSSIEWSTKNRPGVRPSRMLIAKIPPGSTLQEQMSMPKHLKTEFNGFILFTSPQQGHYSLPRKVEAGWTLHGFWSQQEDQSVNLFATVQGDLCKEV